MTQRKIFITATIGFALLGSLIYFSQIGSKGSIINTAQGKTITVYKSPTCGCCEKHVAYLRRSGFTVEVKDEQNIGSIKEQFGVPQEIASCHTAVLGEYIIEGHMPIEAIEKLIQDQPLIKGIALPGMPSGSPGMPGSKEGIFKIISFTKNGDQNVFQEI